MQLSSNGGAYKANKAEHYSILAEQYQPPKWQINFICDTQENIIDTNTMSICSFYIPKNALLLFN